MARLNMFNRNFILYGDVDFYCIICKETLKTITDVEKHIRWEEHREIINRPGLAVLKLEEDRIYQFPVYYYCQFCNCLAVGRESVDAHILTDDHKFNKIFPIRLPETGLVKRVNSEILINDKIIMKETEWQGIDVENEFCLLCNTEAPNFKGHLLLKSHLNNLIRAKVSKFAHIYYRQIRENVKYCLECKVTFANEEFVDHYLNIHCPKENRVERKKTRKLFDFDYEREIAKCRYCNKKFKTNFHNLLYHKKLEHPSTNPEEDADEEDEAILYCMSIHDHGKHRSILKTFGSYSHMKLDRGARKAYCDLCNAYVTPHLNNFTEHITGARHISLSEMKYNKYKYPRNLPNTVKDFRRIFTSVTPTLNKNIVQVNGNVYMTLLSFLGLSPVDQMGKLKCYLCDVFISPKDRVHYDQRHIDRLLECQAVSLKEELIREVRRGVLHCGFCNKIFPDWKLLIRHLRKLEHHTRKHFSTELLQRDIVLSKVDVDYEFYFNLAKTHELFTNVMI